MFHRLIPDIFARSDRLAGLIVTPLIFFVDIKIIYIFRQVAMLRSDKIISFNVFHARVAERGCSNSMLLYSVYGSAQQDRLFRSGLYVYVEGRTRVGLFARRNGALIGFTILAYDLKMKPKFDIALLR